MIPKQSIVRLCSRSLNFLGPHLLVLLWVCHWERGGAESQQAAADSGVNRARKSHWRRLRLCCLPAPDSRRVNEVNPRGNDAIDEVRKGSQDEVTPKVLADKAAGQPLWELALRQSEGGIQLPIWHQHFLQQRGWGRVLAMQQVRLRSLHQVHAGWPVYRAYVLQRGLNGRSKEIKSKLQVLAIT